MRYASLALLTSLSLTVSPVPAQSSNSVAIQRQLKPLMDEQAAAANAHDTDRFLKTYRHSPQKIFIVNGETVRALTRCMHSNSSGGRTERAMSSIAKCSSRSFSP